MTALDGHGRALTLWHDAAKTAAAIAQFSPPRRRALAGVHRGPAAAGRPRRVGVRHHAAVDRRAGRPRAVGPAAHAATRSAALGRDDGYRLLRWGPMAVADLVAEFADTPLLRAALAADGVFGSMLGPWSAGSGLLFLLHAANDVAGDARSVWPRGGPGALAEALRRGGRRPRGATIVAGARAVGGRHRRRSACAVCGSPTAG